ncbi:MAG: ABC transporter permease family protein, partial [Isosphaeraceae bacterium]
MVGFRWARGAIGMVAGAIAVLPAAALGLAALVDRGENGELRPPWFPLALFVSDPFARTCVRNSLIFAVAVTVASLVLGVGLGMAVVRGRSWGRGAIRAMLASMLAASPACLALGIVGLLERRGAHEAPAAWRASAYGGVSLESWSGLPAWGWWAWATLPASVALVALATASGVDRVGATWLDAARLSGAGPLGSWYRVTWPMIRPRAARAAAIVFPMALLEPGAPLILGLRRTLAYQIVESATRPAPFPRLAVWTAMAAVFSFAARWLLG